jgi:hypothetical protein
MDEAIVSSLWTRQHMKRLVQAIRQNMLAAHQHRGRLESNVQRLVQAQVCCYLTRAIASTWCHCAMEITTTGTKATEATEATEATRTDHVC